MTVNFGKLLLVFVILPFVELFLLLRLAAVTSVVFTFVTIISTGIIGAFFAKQQGQKVFSKIQAELQLGRLPSDNLLHGLCVLIGGILLLTPGLISDTFGLMLIVPITRTWITKLLKRQFSTVMQREVVRIYPTYKEQQQSCWSVKEDDDTENQ